VLFLIGGLLRGVSGPQNPASLAISMGFSWIVLLGVFVFSRERADGVALGLRERLGLTCLFIFPALIWLISAPLVSVVQKAILVFLQSQVTTVVFTVFDLVGASLEREGSVLILNGTDQVGVEEACSGIRSLTACLFAGSFLAAVFLNKFWKQLCLIVAAMGLAFLTNMCRALFLTYWAYNHGSSAIDDHWMLPLIGDIGTVHDVTGFLILGVTCVGLVCLLPIFNYSPEVPKAFLTEDPEGPAEGTETSSE
jgi:exosortase/archaeosortase family protein